MGFEMSGASSARHIIPVIGHTFNEDTWVAPATRDYFDGGLSYYPSENWLSTYVVHDDNFGPYFWMVEASAPELFSATRRKFGEILIKSDVLAPKSLNWSLFLLARLPGEIVRLKPGIDIQSSGTVGHVGLFKYPKSED